MKTFFGPILVYALVALILFGDVLAPLAFATTWSDRLGLASWRWITLSCTLLCAGLFFLPARWLPSMSTKLSLFVALTMATATAAIGIKADQVRQDRIAAFGPDERIEHSFFRSIREAPREHQTFLHSAVLKDCVAYGWSYRAMSFYRIKPNAARNVLPHSWLERCPALSPLTI